MSNSTSIMLQVMRRVETAKPTNDIVDTADTEISLPESHLNPGLGAKIGHQLKHMIGSTINIRLSPTE